MSYEPIRLHAITITQVIDEDGTLSLMCEGDEDLAVYEKLGMLMVAMEWAKAEIAMPEGDDED
jgi:hypothetical protein